MPARNSSRVQGIRLKGQEAVPLEPGNDSPSDPDERLEIDWHAVASALNLPEAAGQYLECKSQGHRGAALQRETGLAAAVLTGFARAWQQRIRKHGPLQNRQQFQRVIRGGNSRCLSYEENVGSGRYAWTLAELGPEFMQILNRERTKNITFSTCFGEPTTNRKSLGGIGRSAIMERKDIGVEMGSDRGTFSGMLSPYGGSPDMYGDVILEGAYAKSLAERGKSRPLLWSHLQHQPIGTVDLIDSPGGLRAQGKLVLGVRAADEAYLLMQNNAVRGLSIGFISKKSKPREGGGRIITEIDLLEASLVALPAAGTAVVDSVKSAADYEEWSRRFWATWHREIARIQAGLR